MSRTRQRLINFDEPGWVLHPDKCLFVEKTYDLLGMAGLVNFDKPEFGSSEGLINFDEPVSSYGKMIHGSSKLRSLFDEPCTLAVAA